MSIAERELRATIVGRACGEQLWLLDERQTRRDVRVEGTLWLQVDLGDEVVFVLGEDGRPRDVRPAAASPPPAQ